MISGAERGWLLPAFIILVVLCLFLIGNKLGSPANAQAEPQVRTSGGILAIPVQIGRDSYGLAMVDTISQTLWIYKLNDDEPADSRLELLAARSWQYDRLLQNYNTTEPKPEQVKMLLQNLGQKQKDLDINILEMAEPNRKDF